ncbi:universal stress protein [Corynebacterium mendelii]|uniref:Universal stress protein n=1 Tax=Corynebacterium mendelii TaxID=2765362 RepID=A0A939E2G5_9CORY|nr:universal stress protein [Corynebacterium mendelii]MBN9645224.1 universal stress protein [Corynebacterium mendelii]
MQQSTTVLIAYDGSEEARRGLEYAVALFTGSSLEVVTAYESISRQAMKTAGAPGVAVVDLTEDAASEDPAYTEAMATCREGAEIIKQLGADCGAHLVETTTSIWSAIVDAAFDLGADVIVTGTRATGGVKGFLQSSTSETVLHNSGLPVLIVPPKNTRPR